MAKVEIARGTAETLVSADGIPLIREAEHDLQPTNVDRNVLRLSLTKYGDIYPGKAIVTLTIAVEVAGMDVATPLTPPPWTKLLRACAMAQSGQAATIFAYRVVGAPVSDLGPLRHGEQLLGSALSGVTNNDSTSYGDGFSHDGGINTTVFVKEGTGGVGTGSGTLVGAVSGTIFNINQRSTNKPIGYAPQSDVNLQASETIELYKDGKALKAKGCVGNVEFQFNHGDAVVARFTMQGVVQFPSTTGPPIKGYVDIAIPTDSFEGHKVPPTFLGSRLSLASPINAPAGYNSVGPVQGNRYGTGGTAGFTTLGSLNQVTLETGNTLVLQPNSLDPDGVNFGFITDRAPQGKFNPTEVLNIEYDFMSRFVAGSPARMHILVGATNHADVTTADLNTFEFLTPGVTMNQLGDADRDGVNIWDASFKIGGGDYDSSPTGELPGNDNEFIIVHR